MIDLVWERWELNP